MLSCTVVFFGLSLIRTSKRVYVLEYTRVTMRTSQTAVVHISGAVVHSCVFRFVAYSYTRVLGVLISTSADYLLHSRAVRSTFLIPN